MLICEKASEIKLVAVDIDGVLTDGHVIFDTTGNEHKKLFYRDMDAIGVGRKFGLEFVFITAEDTEMVTAIANRFGVFKVERGAKDKITTLIRVCRETKTRQEHTCYLGDSDRDAPAILWAGLGVAPADASRAAKEAADYTTTCKGGDGVLAEVVELIAQSWAFSRKSIKIEYDN